MTIIELLNIVPPPTTPSQPGTDEEWARYQRENKIILPADYVALIRYYGCGAFLEYLYNQGPFDGDGLMRKHQLESDSYLSLRDVVKAWNKSLATSYSVFPTPGGLLYLGHTNTSDNLFWLTTGEPNDWPIVMMSRELEEHDRFECGVVEVLVRWFEGTLRPNVLIPASTILRHSPDCPRFRQNPSREKGA